MDNDALPPVEGEKPEIAEAGGLFHETANSKPDSSPAADPGPGGGLEDYALKEPVEEPAARTPASSPPFSPPPAKETARPRARDASPGVDQIWTRGAEWGKTLAILAFAGLLWMGALYVFLVLESYGTAFVALLAGGLAMVFLAYPILVTLERPVRMTPEQAVNDFFGSLSHHFPHYRRMWLLLSRAGKVSSKFATQEGFERYWRERLAEMKQGKASALTPLKFQIEDFRAPKSAGRSEIEATFTLRVLVRGRHAAGPIATFHLATSLVKGPDAMWYLDQGDLI